MAGIGWGHEAAQSAGQASDAFHTAQVTMHKMPRIWTQYLESGMHRRPAFHCRAHRQAAELRHFCQPGLGGPCPSQVDVQFGGCRNSSCALAFPWRRRRGCTAGT
jgi:hypothetical protein